MHIMRELVCFIQANGCACLRSAIAGIRRASLKGPRVGARQRDCGESQPLENVSLCSSGMRRVYDELEDGYSSWKGGSWVLEQPTHAIKHSGTGAAVCVPGNNRTER